MVKSVADWDNKNTDEIYNSPIAYVLNVAKIMEAKAEYNNIK